MTSSEKIQRRNHRWMWTLSACITLLVLMTQVAHISPPTTAPTTVENPYDTYGIDTTLYQRTEERVQAGQTLEAILTNNGVPQRIITEVSSQSVIEGIFDPGMLKTGNDYLTYQDSAKTTHYLIYKETPQHFVVFHLQDFGAVYADSLRFIITQKYVEGVIRPSSSLYQTLENKQVTPELALILANKIFAWQIDFYSMRPGDRFRILYNDRILPDTRESVGIQILAVHLEHNGEEFDAFRFDDGYYDEGGHSMQLAFLLSPIEFNPRITSRFSRSRFHPVQKRYKPHFGTDFAAPTGTPIQTTADGTVTEVSHTQGNGYYVKIRHNNAYATAYLHMSRHAPDIQKGTRVKQGKVIGYVGSTGLATGPHVCYRFWVKGIPKDPLSIEMPTSESVADSLRTTFDVHRASLQHKMEEHHRLMTKESTVQRAALLRAVNATGETPPDPAFPVQ